MATGEIINKLKNVQSDVWSLGCDITIEDMDVVLQEIKVDDIVLSGTVVIKELSIDIDYDRVKVMDLDLNVSFDGVSSSIVESQVVPFANILGITDLSPEASDEKRFAASAYSAKKIHDYVSSIENRLGILEEEVENDDNETGEEEQIKEFERRITSLERLLDWFEFDNAIGQIKAKYGLYTYGGLTAGGRGELGKASIGDLSDIDVNNPVEGQVLVYDAESNRWINKSIKIDSNSGSGEGANASLERDIKAGVALGYIKKNDILAQGMTLTDVFVRMLTADITTTAPSVRINNVPSDVEVGTVVNLNLSNTYTDGKFGNTSVGTVNAGCAVVSTKYSLDGSEIEPTHSFVASDTKTYKIKVNVQHTASTVTVQNAAGEESSVIIPAGTVSNESSFDASYRYFWGYMTDSEYEKISSSAIRGLEESGFIDSSSSKIVALDAEHEVPGGEDLIIAVPDGYNVEAIDMTTSRPIKFPTPAIVPVTCGGSLIKDYKVYRYDNYTSYPMYITKITIEKEA